MKSSFLNELKHEQKVPIKISCDNKFTIALINNIMFHGKSIHKSIKFHYIRKLIKKNGELSLSFID